MITKALQLRFSLTAFCLVTLISCNFALLPPYNKEISTQIDNTAKAVDRFYLDMLEKTDAAGSGRAYANFADGYIDIEVELNSLYTKNRIRPLNKASTRNCEIALHRWREYKEEHKEKNTISNGLIAYKRQYMSDLFYTIQVSEEFKQ